MQLREIRRFPVKSMLGEVVSSADVGERGLAGDRLWAVRDADGKFGSGKNTRRFRRMPGLFRLRAYAAEPAPVVEMPDGRRFDAADVAGHRAVGEILGRRVTLAAEASVPHHDEGPVSLLTTASLRSLSKLSGGGDIDPLRFRANLLIDGAAEGFPEDEWPGRRVRIGADVVLRIVKPLTRCVMIDMRQDGAAERSDLLKTLTEYHEMILGVVAAVERPGRVATGDVCRWT
ncbi:MOSC domain-containing protein [Actinoplanes sp. NPDC049681]|uniref:MOSC domain-containing protein n=1 Tax=Actinoplanes sp. NPDC049681 TaxID=3363905 RepID=UPI003795069A